MMVMGGYGLTKSWMNWRERGAESFENAPGAGIQNTGMTRNKLMAEKMRRLSPFATTKKLRMRKWSTIVF
jgi:hypothetical protein